jgi:hypothetical protein
MTLNLTEGLINGAKSQEARLKGEIASLQAKMGRSSPSHRKFLEKSVKEYEKMIEGISRERKNLESATDR